MSDALMTISSFHPVSKFGTRHELVSAIETLLRTIGADAWLVTGVPMPGQNLRQHILSINWPAVWEARYFRERMWESDPFLTQSLGARSHISANCMTEQGLLQPQAREFIAQAKAAGMGDQLAISCVRPGRYQIVVLPSFKARPDKDDLFLVAGMVQRLVDRLHEVSPDCCERAGQLTQREREIVFHTSSGKTSNEIADELGIRPRTVFAHLTSAGEKLRATNKTETVVNAYRYNQIPF